MKKRATTIFLVVCLIISLLAACGLSVSKETGNVTSATATLEKSSTETETSVITDTENATANVSSSGAIDTTELFTERDLSQTADLTEAETLTVTDGQDISITAEGVYVITGSAENVTIRVETDDTAKVQLVLSDLVITNEDFPCIYVTEADKAFVTLQGDNELSVTGTFTADGSTNTDGVIFSLSDLVLNGSGSLSISSTDNGIVGKDDLKITGGTYTIRAVSKAIEANDSIRIADGNFTLVCGTDALHAENDEDDSLGFIYICGGTFAIDAGDDGIHGTSIVQIDGGAMTISAAEGIEGTWIQINGGSIAVKATDDGVNGAQKSNAYRIAVEINGGELSVDMGSGDTDAIDSNGDLIITGGTISITAQSPFDCDGSLSWMGGTVIVNGQEVNTLSNQMMGGEMGKFRR